MAQIRTETRKSAIVLDKLAVTEFTKAGTKTAQIRQSVETKSYYPSKKVDSDLQNNLFAASDFGFQEQVFTSVENRVAFIPVPEGLTEAQVQEKLTAAHGQGACIYRVLSNEPILDENQQYAITQGLKTKDDFANTQVVRTPSNPETVLNGTANKLILDKAENPQYRRTFFWKTPMEDKDVRTASRVYLSAEIEAELGLMKAESHGASVLEGQTI